MHIPKLLQKTLKWGWGPAGTSVSQACNSKATLASTAVAPTQELPRTSSPQPVTSHHEKTPDKANQRHTLPNPEPELLKMVKVMRSQESLGDGPRPEGTKETTEGRVALGGIAHRVGHWQRAGEA